MGEGERRKMRIAVGERKKERKKRKTGTDRKEMRRIKETQDNKIKKGEKTLKKRQAISLS